MHPYPHLYTAGAAAAPTGLVAVNSPQLPPIQSASPPEFDGPGGVWSPETLLCAALADCFILTFRAISRTGQLKWLHLECQMQGVLERVEKVPQFTRFTNTVKLIVAPGSDVAAARRLLEQAERGCLIANSLRGTRELAAEVIALEP